MKQYVVDELRPADREKLKAHLDAHYGGSSVHGIYWVPLAAQVLSPRQAGHTDCQPLCFAMDLGPTSLCCELLIRTHSRMRCDCMGYADETQRNWIVSFVDTLLDRLGILT